jgi:hypothetical protein
MKPFVGVSWQILVEDLDRICADLDAGNVPSLPPRTASFAEWPAAISTGRH